MKQRHEQILLIIILMVILGISLLVIGGSMRLLPDAPLFPTPTQPKAIDFPDSRPVPAH
jgi:hypothetical protein